MDPEQHYKFIDKSGSCFHEFASKDKSNHFAASMFIRGHAWGCGDMLAFRDDLVAAGFEWGTDFYVVKLPL